MRLLELVALCGPAATRNSMNATKAAAALPCIRHWNRRLQRKCGRQYIVRGRTGVSERPARLTIIKEDSTTSGKEGMPVHRGMEKLPLALPHGPWLKMLQS